MKRIAPYALLVGAILFALLFLIAAPAAAQDSPTLTSSTPKGSPPPSLRLEVRPVAYDGVGPDEVPYYSSAHQVRLQLWATADEYVDLAKLRVSFYPQFLPGGYVPSVIALRADPYFAPWDMQGVSDVVACEGGFRDRGFLFAYPSWCGRCDGYACCARNLFPGVPQCVGVLVFINAGPGRIYVAPVPPCEDDLSETGQPGTWAKVWRQVAGLGTPYEWDDVYFAVDYPVSPPPMLVVDLGGPQGS